MSLKDCLHVYVKPIPFNQGSFLSGAGKVFLKDGEINLKMKNGAIYQRLYDDDDGCPVFGMFGTLVVQPEYVRYPDGQLDWLSESIIAELQDHQDLEEVTFNFYDKDVLIHTEVAKIPRKVV